MAGRQWNGPETGKWVVGQLKQVASTAIGSASFILLWWLASFVLNIPTPQATFQRLFGNTPGTSKSGNEAQRRAKLDAEMFEQLVGTWQVTNESPNYVVSGVVTVIGLNRDGTFVIKMEGTGGAAVTTPLIEALRGKSFVDYGVWGVTDGKFQMRMDQANLHDRFVVGRVYADNIHRISSEQFIVGIFELRRIAR